MTANLDSKTMQTLLDEKTGETVIITNGKPAKARLTDSNGRNLLPEQEAQHGLMKQLADRQRIREEERALAQMEAAAAAAKKPETENLAGELAAIKEKLAKYEASAQQQSQETSPAKTLSSEIASGENANGKVDNNKKKKTTSTAEKMDTETTAAPDFEQKIQEFLEKREAEKKAKEDLEAKEKQSKEEAEQKQAELVKKLVEEKLAQIQGSVSGKKRKAAPADADVDEEDDDDAIVVEPNAAEANGNLSKYDADIQEAQKKFGNFKRRLNSLMKRTKDHNATRGDVDDATFQAAEASLNKSKAKLLADQQELFAFFGDKLAEYYRQTNGAAAGNYQDVMSPAMAYSSPVPVNKLNEMQSYVEASASSARAHQKHQQGLKDLEKKLFEERERNARQQLTIKQYELTGRAGDAVAKQDPYLRQQSAMQQQQQQSATKKQRTESAAAPPSPDNFHFTAFHNPSKLVSTASSRSTAGRVQKGDDNVAVWRQAPPSSRYLPGPNLTSIVNATGAFPGQLEPPAPLYDAACFSKHPQHRELWLQLLEESRASLPGPGRTKMGRIYPGDHYGTGDRDRE